MTLLEDIERLADQVYGKGVAVSVDREPLVGYIVRIWDLRGKKILSTGHPNKTSALRAMRETLRRSKFLRLEASASGEGEKR